MEEKSYNLFGSTWKIKYVDQLLNDSKEWIFGQMESPERVITVSTKKPDGTPLNEDDIEITTFHEIVHSIFHNGQYGSCYSDEPLVEWTARCLKALKDQGIFK